jgi:hypothetical protein
MRLTHVRSPASRSPCTVRCSSWRANAGDRRRGLSNWRHPRHPQPRRVADRRHADRGRAAALRRRSRRSLGAEQFDVAAHRLQHEYGVEARVILPSQRTPAPAGSRRTTLPSWTASSTPTSRPRRAGRRGRLRRCSPPTPYEMKRRAGHVAEDPVPRAARARRPVSWKPRREGRGARQPVGRLRPFSRGFERPRIRDPSFLRPSCGSSNLQLHPPARAVAGRPRPRPFSRSDCARVRVPGVRRRSCRESRGWIPPRGDERLLYYAAHSHWLDRARARSRSCCRPPSVVRQEAQVRVRPRSRGSDRASQPSRKRIP